MVEDLLKRILGEDEEIIILAAQTVGAHLQLMGTLLAADVEDALLWHVKHRLQRERTFADTRLSAKKHNAAWHEPAAQNAVQLFVVHVDAWVIVVGDVTQAQYLVFFHSPRLALSQRGGGRARSL